MDVACGSMSMWPGSGCRWCAEYMPYVELSLGQMTMEEFRPRLSYLRGLQLRCCCLVESCISIVPPVQTSTSDDWYCT